jgi:hypothetical protein
METQNNISIYSLLEEQNRRNKKTEDKEVGTSKTKTYSMN